MSDPARMKTDEPVFGMLEAALYNAPLWKQGTVIFDGYAGQFQTDQDQIGWVNSPEITDADGNTLTGLDSKRSIYRKENPYWNALNAFNPPALTRDQQERIANQRYESSSGTIYTQDNIMALYSVEDTKEFWDTSGGPTHLQKRIRDTLDETERAEAMFQHGVVLGYASMIISGTLDPVGIGTFLLTKNRIPGVRQANEARRALKNIRALEKSVEAGKSLSTAQSLSLTRWDKIAKAFPSTAKRLGYAVGANASEATLSLYFESLVDEKLDLDDYVSAVGAAGVFTTAIMGLGAGGARAMQHASKVYQKAMDNHLVKQIGRVEKQSAPGRSLPTPQEREDLVSMALDIAKTNEEPFKVSYERLLKMSGKIHDFAVRTKSFNQLKDRPSDLIYDDNPFVRGLSNILFRQNVLLDADDFDPKIAISDFLAHHRQVVDNQKYVTSETAREFIAPDTPNGDQEWLDAVIELLDEAPVEKVDEQGVTRMVDRLDADNSPYLEKSEAWKEAARKEAETIRNTIFVYEGEELGLAERKAFYFPHGNRVKEYLTDDDKVEQFEKNVEEYLRDEIGITDPDEIKKFTDRATSSIQSSGPGSEVSLGFTIDDSGRIGNEFLAQSEVSTPGQTKERTINLPFRVMRPFYQEDSHLVLDTAMSRNNVVMATQELLKLNPKGHLDLLPKPKPEFRTAEQPFPATPRPVEGEGIDLNIEAKKYETAEEFVESQGVSVYHGGDKAIKNIDEINFKDDVFYTLKRTDAELKEIAGALREDSFYSYDDLSKMPDEAFGKNVSEFVVKFENPKVIDAKGKSWLEFTDEGMSDWTNKIVRETGGVHDGIIIKNINEGFSATGTLGAQAGLVDDYIVLKKSAIKTKSQLTDIWNKAQGEASGVTPENPIVGPLKPVEVPDYRDDWNSDTVKLKARESWSNPDEAAESLDRILRTTKSTEEAYVNARTAKKDHNAVIKENRQQLKDKNAQIKEEFGEEVAGRTDSLNDLLDEEDLFTEELENLLEIQLEGEQGLESIGNQLRKFSDRVTRNLATESRKIKALKESKGVRAVRRDEADKLCLLYTSDAADE